MAKRLIKLHGEPLQHEDRKAAEAITPGMLIGYNGSGDMIKFNSAGAFAECLIALEREEMGNSIDVDYAINDVVKSGVFSQGTRFLGLIGSGQNIAKDSYLEAGAIAGTFRAYSAGVRLARALETVNNTAGPNSARIRLVAL